MFRPWRLTLLVALALITSGIVPSNAVAQSADQIRVATEFGLGYAPLYIVAKRAEFIHKYLPNVNINFVQLSGGAAIRDALISNTIDVGGLAMSPVIQAWDKGADVKIALGMSFMPTELITYRPDIKSMKDVKPTDKLNVVSLGSPQSLEVKMAAEKYFGSLTSLDTNMVTMPHPDAVAALESKRDIAAEFATPPYIRILMQQPGMHSILSNRDREFPDANFMLIVAAASGRFVHDKPEYYSAMVKAIRDAIDWMNAKPNEAAAFLAADQPASKLTAADWLAEMKQPGVKFSPVPQGLGRLMSFMARVGIIAKAGTYDDVTWQNLHNSGGS